MSHVSRSNTQQPLDEPQAQSQPAYQHQYQPEPEYLNQAPPQPEYLQAAAQPSELDFQPEYLQPEQALFEPDVELATRPLEQYDGVDWTQLIPQQGWQHGQQHQYQEESLPAAPPPSDTTIDPAVLQQTPQQPYVAPSASMPPPGPIHRQRYWPLDMLTRPFVPAVVEEEESEEGEEDDDDEREGEGEEEGDDYGEEEEGEETDLEALERQEEQTGEQADAGAVYWPNNFEDNWGDYMNTF